MLNFQGVYLINFEGFIHPTQLSRVIESTSQGVYFAVAACSTAGLAAVCEVSLVA